MARIEKSGYPSELKSRIRQALASARADGLPVEPLLSRLDEGLAKAASAEAIASAVERRGTCLRAARRIAAETGYAQCPEAPRNQLVTVTALAMESGLPGDDVQAVFMRGQGRFAMRMASVIEAGEALRLGGFEHACVRNLLIDFVDRNLGRMEIVRALNYCLQQRRSGRSEADIRAGLWGNVTTTNCPKGANGPSSSSR